MNKLNLLIVEKDEEYLKALANYISNNHFNEFRVTAISDEEYFNKYLEEDQIIDILLINQQFYNEDIRNKFIKKILILGDESIKQENMQDDYIYKYQLGSNIYKKIKSKFLSVDSEYLNRAKKEGKVTCCYSPIGGSGKTIISVLVALGLSEKSKEVLYLNFEDIPSTSIYFKCDNTNFMSELLYLAKERNSEFKSRIVEHLKVDNNGIYYFNPINSVLDLETINREDILYFIDEIKSLNKFDDIIIDMSSKFDLNYGGILNKADSVIAILGTDIASKSKMDIFLKQQESIEKYIFIINKYKIEKDIDVIPDEIKKGKKSILAKIEYYPAIDGNLMDIKQLKENNQFSITINQIVQKIFFI